MPELPEVETLRRGLEACLVGRRIVQTRVLVPKMLKGSVTDSQEFACVLQNCRIETIGRRGKHLLIALDSGYNLALHLNMRGQLLVVPRSLPDAKYLAAGFAVDDGRELRFADMWTWGEMRLMTGRELASHAPLLLMGPEPLSPDWAWQEFAQALARRARTSIKAALLDQTIVAGVGNIYADEALFRSGIRPERPAGMLRVSEIEGLHRAIRAVLGEATEGGGTTSDNYVDAQGQSGCYVPRVYDRAGQACLSCGALLERMKITGRGTTFCPTCQC